VVKQKLSSSLIGWEELTEYNEKEGNRELERIFEAMDALIIVYYL
jgi:hypothetical protein